MEGVEIISDVEAFDAVERMGQTDVQYGQLCARVKAAEFLAKQAKAQAWLQASGTGQQREQLSIVSQAYKDAWKEWTDAVCERESLAAQRKTLELKVEVWRSLNAAKRKALV